MSGRSLYAERDSAQVANNLVALGLLSPSTLEKTQQWTQNRSQAPSRSEDSTRRSPTLSRGASYPEPGQDRSASPWLSRRNSGQRRNLSPNQQRSPPIGSRDPGGMIDMDRAYIKRDRTFAGSRCIICEEPSEHTLRNERILQLSCSHLAHEACFYELIRDYESQRCPGCEAPLGLDPGRGGNVLDIEKLSNIVRSLQYPPPASFHDYRASPMPWDQYSAYGGGRPYGYDNFEFQRQHAEYLFAQSQMAAQGHMPHMQHMQHMPHQMQQYQQMQQMPSQAQDSNGSYMGNKPPALPLAGPSIISARRHTRNRNSVDTVVASPQNSAPPKNPISPPLIHVRSEYPTLTRSRQQQSLTCLISVEVPEGRWQPESNDPHALEQTSANESDNPAAGSNAPSPVVQQQQYEPQHSPEELEQITEDLHARVDNWHGLDFTRFGPLKLHSKLQVGKDRQSWQELECFLFTEMLICIKDKKTVDQVIWEGEAGANARPKATLKGSIMIKKHLSDVEASEGDQALLTLKLTVPELPSFHLHFPTHRQMDTWARALTNKELPEGSARDYGAVDNNASETDEYGTNERNATSRNSQRNNHHTNQTSTTSATAVQSKTEYSTENSGSRLSASFYAPLDLIVVVPVSSSMHGIKLTLLRDALAFLLHNLGSKDRLGLIAFGANVGITEIAALNLKAWHGWSRALDSLGGSSQRSARGDVIEGTNIAMDMLMNRKSNNPLASVFIISDASTSDGDGIDFVVSRAEAAKVSLYSFGLGLTHKPDSMIELSTRTEGSYTYVKDWMMLRECVAGCLGSVQSTSHQDVKLKIRLPEGSPAKFTKVSGAVHVTKRASGRDVEIALGDLRFGDKRDILVQLAIAPENFSTESSQDPWESIVSGLEALGGPIEQDDARTTSVEEVPMVQADLVFGDITRSGALSQSSRPSLLAVTMLAPPTKAKPNRPSSLPIPPHQSIVQRRMELLTSDMLTRALTLVGKGQNDRAHHLLRETRSILKGLGKGGLPPLPSTRTPSRVHSPTPSTIPPGTPGASNANPEVPEKPAPSPGPQQSFSNAAGVDGDAMTALDAELESALEWINHPAVFARDSRKAILQVIGAISSQRAYTFRSPLESLWANRIPGIRNLSARSREWRRGDEDGLSGEE